MSGRYGAWRISQSGQHLHGIVYTSPQPYDWHLHHTYALHHRPYLVPCIARPRHVSSSLHDANTWVTWGLSSFHRPAEMDAPHSSYAARPAAIHGAVSCTRPDAGSGHFAPAARHLPPASLHQADACPARTHTLARPGWLDRRRPEVSALASRDPHAPLSNSFTVKPRAFNRTGVALNNTPVPRRRASRITLSNTAAGHSPGMPAPGCCAGTGLG
jgi:hypothetical protein